jgi:hypothetical protein
MKAIIIIILCLVIGCASLKWEAMEINPPLPLDCELITLC